MVPEIVGIARAPRTAGTQALGIATRSGATGLRSVERFRLPTGRRNSLFGALDFLDLVAFDRVADLDVLELLDADAAFVALLD